MFDYAKMDVYKKIMGKNDIQAMLFGDGYILSIQNYGEKECYSLLKKSECGNETIQTGSCWTHFKDAVRSYFRFGIQNS